MADEKIISPHAFSKFELHVELDGNELSIPINLGMSDAEVRKIYPYLLSVSRPEDNPMINFAKMQESGEINRYTPEEQARYEAWASRMSRYWYNKPSTSLLDVAIGLAIDMKFHGTRLGDIEDIPDSEYEGNMTNPMNPSLDKLSFSETQDLEKRYNLQPDSDAPVTLSGEVAAHRISAGNIEVDMYGDDKVDDFLSSELDEVESKLDYRDKFAEMIEKDYNDNISEDSYKLQDVKSKTLSESDIDKDSGLLILYDDTDIFAKVSGESEEPEDKYPEDESYDDDNIDDDNDIDEEEDEDDLESNIDADSVDSLWMDESSDDD